MSDHNHKPVTWTDRSYQGLSVRVTEERHYEGFLKESECWTIIPYPFIWQRSSDVQENMTADTELPPASVYERLPHIPERKKRMNTYS